MCREEGGDDQANNLDLPRGCRGGQGAAVHGTEVEVAGEAPGRGVVEGVMGKGEEVRPEGKSYSTKGKGELGRGGKGARSRGEGGSVKG